MPYGISETGFELPRLTDLILETRQRAVSIFQDLLGPNDILDTSDSSTIGRFINLFVPVDAILWEQAQLSYSSLDPNTALGPALDNIVQYGGIVRQSPSYSTVTGLFTGDNGTSIPSSSVIGSNLHDNTFTTVSLIVLNPIDASGISVQVNSVANTTVYSISYSVSSTSNNIVSITSDSSATQDEILSALKTEIDSAHPTLVASITGSVLTVNKSEAEAVSTFSTSANMGITKISKLGNLRAEEIGPESAEANSLNIIKTPVLGWDSVTNPLAASEGRLTESDEDLRLRFRNTKYERSTNILDSLYSALVSLPTVENVAVYENTTDGYVNPETGNPDPSGMPPHSFTVVILGGQNEDIANTIWRNKPSGIGSNGTVVVNITDSQGFIRPIKFERPDPIPIYIEIELDKDQDFPANGENQIRSAIIDFAKQYFSVGDDIVYSRLYTPINQVQGHSVVSLKIGTSPSPTGTSDIPIDFDQIGSFQSINIIITSA